MGEVTATRWVGGVMSLVLCAGVAALAPASPAAGAVTLISDGFGDGDRNNDGVSDSGGLVDDAGDTGVAWWKAKGNDGQTFTVVDDSTGLGSGLAMQVETNFSAPQPVSSPTAVAHFAKTTLNDGDAISLSFNARLTSVPAASDRRFRWGLFASNSTDAEDFTKSSDGGSTNDNVNHWSGFIGRVDVGPGSPGVFAINQNNTGSLLNANEFLVGSDDTALAMDDTTSHSYTLTLERSGNHLIVTASADGVVISKSTLEDEEDGGAIGPISFDFDSLAIGYNGFNASPFIIDNVSVIYTPVPEPAAMSLLALGAVLAVARTR